MASLAVIGVDSIGGTKNNTHSETENVLAIVERLNNRAENREVGISNIDDRLGKLEQNFQGVIRNLNTLNTSFDEQRLTTANEFRDLTRLITRLKQLPAPPKNTR